MIHKKHKDILIRVIAGLIGGAYVGYIARLLATGNTLVTGHEWVGNYITMSICLVIGVVFIINILYKPLIQKRIRLTIALTGLGLIILGHYTLTDTATAQLYLSDLTKLFGVLVFVGGATGAIIPTDTIEDIQESNIEIIEA